MENNTKLLNKNFMIMVIGQIISLFGNAILRFALPLYLLEETGSAALFGLVSACSFIPMIILTPFGGIIADRVNKKYIMVALDFVTAVVMVAFTICIGKTNLVFLIIITLMILYGIQGAYQPSVQASLPFLVEKENLLKGNAIINQVSALANLIGPIIGGLLYGVYGLLPILIASIVCFVLAVIMEMIMKIPYVKNESKSSMIAILKDDIKSCLKGRKFIPNDIVFASERSVNVDDKNIIDTLSDREMTVFLAMCQGKTNKDIATDMLLSEKTVSTYKTRLMQKLQVENVVELIELAKRCMII